MPKAGVRESFELQTRDRYTKVQCELGVTVDGRELPSMSVIGGALEAAKAVFEAHITESYKVVPARNEYEQPGNVTPLPPAPVPSAPAVSKPVPFGS